MAVRNKLIISRFSTITIPGEIEYLESVVVFMNIPEIPRKFYHNISGRRKKEIPFANNMKLGATIRFWKMKLQPCEKVR